MKKRDKISIRRQDSTIDDQVVLAEAYLASRLRGRLRDVSVSVQRGGIVIRGTTTSYYVKQLAQHAVMNRISLPIAANEIKVLN